MQPNYNFNVGDKVNVTYTDATTQVLYFLEHNPEHGLCNFTYTTPYDGRVAYRFKDDIMKIEGANDGI
jgi:hypothetical protein